jgi:RimJ/RimL family protein N-acetyltransferase
MDAMATASMDDTLPSITLRRLDTRRAKAIIDREPCLGDHWVSGYPAEGDVEAAAMALRTLTVQGSSPFACYEVVDAVGRIVGGAGFHGPPRFDGVVEIGYGVAPSIRNRGFAKAAIRALVSIAIENGAKQIVARTDPENQPSRRALERMGFAFDHLDEDFAHLVFDCTTAHRNRALSR